jgi:hypothetical protein
MHWPRRTCAAWAKLLSNSGPWQPSSRPGALFRVVYYFDRYVVTAWLQLLRSA